MTHQNPVEDYERLLDGLKSAYGAIEPSEEARRRVRDRAFSGREKTPSRRLAGNLGWVAVAVVPWVFAVALYFHVTASGAADPGLVTAPARTDDAPSVAPYGVSVEAGTVLVPLPSARGDHEFDLVSGRATFRVAPLEPGARFAVRAGDALVEVVGTVFSVERDERCVRVSVERGAVRATFVDRLVTLAAGQRDEFCTLAAVGEPSPRERRSGSVAAPVAASREESLESPPAPAGPTEEERLYREALDARLVGDVPRCRERMGEYVTAWPDGTFVDEALFTLVRLDYRSGDFASVGDHSGRYLARNRSLDAKTAEARLLRAESLERLGDGGVLEALRPLAGSIDILASEYREQALYLLALSAERAGEDGLALRSAREYLARFPTGKYAGRAAQLVEKFEAKGSDPAGEDTVPVEGGKQP